MTAAWDWQAVRDRIVEARATAALLPRVRGPKAFGGSWPGFQSDYGSVRVFRPRPEPAAIDRMDEVLRWLAALDTDADRQILNDFAFLKTTPRARIGVWCEKNGWPERIFRRRVQLICQRIADDLSLNRQMRLDAEHCGLSENAGELVVEALPLKTVPHEMMATDARPENLPEHPDRKAVIRRMERWATARSRKTRMAEAGRP